MGVSDVASLFSGSPIEVAKELTNLGLISVKEAVLNCTKSTLKQIWKIRNTQEFRTKFSFIKNFFSKRIAKDIRIDNIQTAESQPDPNMIKQLSKNSFSIKVGRILDVILIHVYNEKSIEVHDDRFVVRPNEIVETPFSIEFSFPWSQHNPLYCEDMCFKKRVRLDEIDSLLPQQTIDRIIKASKAEITGNADAKGYLEKMQGNLLKIREESSVDRLRGAVNIEPLIGAYEITVESLDQDYIIENHNIRFPTTYDITINFRLDAACLPPVKARFSVDLKVIKGVIENIINKTEQQTQNLKF